jgi:hypothetical protein
VSQLLHNIKKYIILVKFLLLNSNVKLDTIKMDNYEIVEVEIVSVCGVMYIALIW